jgi:endonuclease-3
MSRFPRTLDAANLMPAKKSPAAKAAKPAKSRPESANAVAEKTAKKSSTKSPAKQPVNKKPGAKKTASAKQPAEDPAALKARTAKIVALLAKEYADAECALHHKSPFELLVATILSAQCTDERVNMVTPALFKKYPTPAAFAVAPIEDIEKAIQSTGFFRNKAKSIKAASQALVEKHNGKVPQTLEEMIQLAGVGRKTANVVLGVAYKIPTGVVVDTHVGRLSRRLGLTHNEDPVKVESDLVELLPKREWIDFSHRLIHHGRRICQARKPKCDACILEKLCPKIGVV